MKNKVLEKAIKRFLILASVGLVALLSAYYMGFILVLEHSMPRGLYRVTSGEVERGGIALINLPYKWSKFGLDRGYLHPSFSGESERRAIKQVVAIEGDEISISPAGIVVNGELLPHTQQQNSDSKGLAMPELILGKVILEKGEIIAISHQQENGFDSRYYGILHSANVHGNVVKVLTEKGSL